MIAVEPHAMSGLEAFAPSGVCIMQQAWHACLLSMPASPTAHHYLQAATRGVAKHLKCSVINSAFEVVLYI